MANPDFFLNFGSNAKTWASGLSGELKPATSSINELTTALERYDAATDNRKTNGPLDSLFTRLDGVSQKFADLTGSLASTFDKAIQGIGLLQEDIASLLRSVQGVHSAAAATKRGPGRTKLDTVPLEDSNNAASLRNAQVLRANINSANEKMSRLADLNGTLATRLSESGDKTVILSKAVGGLIGASHNAIRAVDSLEARLSRFGEGVNIPTGTSGPGPNMAVAEMPGLMASFVEALRGVTLTVGQANIQAARVVSQVETAAKATTAEALEVQRYTTTKRSEMQGPQVHKREVEGSKKPLPVLEGAMWDQPAKAGSYAVGTKKVSLRNADLVAGETFNEHYSRMKALQERFDAIQHKLPTAASLDPVHGPMLQKISDAFFKGGGVHADAVTRGEKLGNSASYSIQQSVRANPGSRFLAGTQDEKMIKRAQEAGLGDNMQQVVERALEFTHQRRIGTEVVPGTLPGARGDVLERFIADELHANPMQTFGGLGNRELSAVRRQMDERILAAGGQVEARGEETTGIPRKPQEMPLFLRNHPDPQALYQGALRRQAKDEEGREFSAGYSAMSQGRREQAQKSELFRDTGRENDASLSRERLSQNYALPTQINRAQEHLSAAQREHEAALAKHVDIMEDVATGNVYHGKNNPDGVTPEQIEAAKVRRDSTAESVQNWQTELDSLRGKLTAQRKNAKTNVDANKEAIQRYDETSENIKKARQIGRDLPNNLVRHEEIDPNTGKAKLRYDERVLTDADIANKLGLKSRTRKVDVDSGHEETLRRHLAESQGLLASYQEDPAAFKTRAMMDPEQARKAAQGQAVADRNAKMAELQSHVSAAAAEMQPAVLAEKTLRDKALDARQKWEQQQVAKGVPISELDAGRKRRDQLRAVSSTGFSGEELAAERKYLEAKYARQQAEADQQEKLAGLQEKAKAARTRANQALLKQGKAASDIDALTRARNAERLANGGFSSQDLPAERAAIEARLSTPQGRYDQARRALTAGVAVAEIPENYVQPERRFRKATSEGFTGPFQGSKVAASLRDEVDLYTKELAQLGTQKLPRKITDEHRAQYAQVMANERAELIRPKLQEFGISAAKAATLAHGTDAEIRAALLEAAAKMDAAAVKQQQAADKAEAKADRDDGFTTTPAVKRQKKGKKVKRFGQVEGEEEVSGLEANLSGEAAATERTAATQILNDRKAVLQVEHDELLARKRVADQGKSELGGNRKSNRKNLDEAQIAALDGFVAESATAKEELHRVSSEMHNLNTEVLKLRGAAKKAADAMPATATGGGAGGGSKPPKRPATTGGGGDEPPERPGKTPANDPYLQEILSRRLETFSPETRTAIEQARQRAAISAETKRLSDEQKSHVLDAAQQFRADPAFRDVDRETARRTFATGLGLPRSSTNNRFLVDTFKPGGLLSADPARNTASGAGTVSQTSAERVERLNGILTQSSGKVREALLAEFVAQERLARIETVAGDNAERLAAAKRSLSVASRNVATASAVEAAESNEVTGLAGLLAHGGRQAARFMSFTIAFSGLEKVRELVDTGIQAQTQFIRLEANLHATGREAEGVMDKLGKISSETAQPLAHTIQAASELTGVLKSEEDLMEGSKIASELANISHGHLTATQAAIGLRDVTDAYGLSGVTALRGVGDMIARISQVTGVSVHDVIEGTTQLAQEARSFGLSQRQAAVLAAEVTKNTGESGEAAAEQVSRVLSTMNNGKVQQLLEGTIVPEFDMEGHENKDAGKQVATQELFAEHGGAGKALTNLLGMYHQLSERQRQSIDALVGAGRQARALTGMLRDAATTHELIEQVSDDEGALATQSERFLHTVGGALQKLGADFRRLGADMLEAHLFDILMIVVSGLDKLMTTADTVIRGMNSLFNSNPITMGLFRMAVLLGEVALAFKVFGSAGSAAMKAVGLGGFVNRFAEGRAAQSIAQAEVASAAPMMFGRTRVMYGMGRDALRGGAAVAPVATAARAMTTAEMLGNPFTGMVAGQAIATGAAVRGASAIGAASRALTPTQALGNPFTGQLASQAEVTTSRLAGLGSGILTLGKSVAGPLLAISALMYLFNEFGKAGEAAKATKAHSISLEDEITGTTAEERKKKNEETHEEEVMTAEEKATKNRERARPRSGFRGFLRDSVDVPKLTTRWRDLITGDTSMGQTSLEFENRQLNDFQGYYQKLNAAEATKDPKKLAEAQKEIDEAIASGAEELVATAGDRDARDRAWSKLYAVKALLDADAQARIQTLMGIGEIDQLSLQQLENIQTFTSKWSNVSSRVMRLDPRAGQDDLVDTGVNPNSTIGKFARQSLTGGALERAQARVALDKAELPQLDVQIAAKPIGDADRDRLIKARDAVFSNLQQQMDLVDQLTIQNADAFAGILQKIGNLPGASQKLHQETRAIKAAMASIQDPTDSGYLGYLSQLADKNQQQADMAVQGGIDAATLHSARNPNRVGRARDDQTIAGLRLDAARSAAGQTRQDLIDLQTHNRQVLQQKSVAAETFRANRYDEGSALVAQNNVRHQADLDAQVATANKAVADASVMIGADATEKAAAVTAAAAAKAQADLAVTQSLQDQKSSAMALKAVMLQAAGAGTLAVDAANVERADADAAAAVKTYGEGSTEANNAQAAAVQARITQKADIHNQTTSAMSLRAAIDANAGNDVGAARHALAKANSDVKFAVENYGKDSQQANDARAAAITANATLQKNIDDALNAALDLEMSMLQNRGNDSDKRRTLDDKVKQATNNLNAFKARGGKMNTPEGQRLTAGVNDAKRNRVDQGAQIEIDTLEFQRATFAISASQEIAALKNILKTKQLTQDRARSIMLQIKGLQNEMQGQFNLGDLKLPTVYDVRRTMAAGRAGAVAAASTVGYQDNKTINIVINGGNLAKVSSVLSDSLGTTATNRVTVAPKKGV